LLIFIVINQYISSEIVLLGAFLSGMLLSMFLHKDRSLLIVKLDSLGYGFFIPVFFIMVGVKFDPTSLKEFEITLIPFLLILLLLLFAVKVLPSLLLTRQLGFRRSLSAGFLLSSRLSLIIAASAIGLELGVITPGINASFLIMAMATCLLGPEAATIEALIVRPTTCHSLIETYEHYTVEETIIANPDINGHKVK
jgi:Kef-type K+ transport system membrane component KefB